MSGLLMSLFEPKADTYDEDRGWRGANVVGGKQTKAGEVISPVSSMALSTYFACIRNLAEDVSNLPLKIYSLEGTGQTEAKDHPLYDLLYFQPNPEMPARTFRETLQAWMPNWGGGYAEIVKDGRGAAKELWPIHPRLVKPKRAASGMLFYEVTQPDGTTVNIRAENMLHIPGLSFDGICGYSMATVAAESLGVAKAAQTFAGTFFGNGTHIGGVLQTPKALSPQARKNLKESWDAAHRGPGNANKTAVLEEDLKWATTTMPMTDAQFLESRQFSKEEIATWFNMPLSRLQDAKRAQGWSTLTSLKADYLAFTLRAWLERWESYCSFKLLSLEDRKKFAIFHDVRDFLSGDVQAMADYCQKRVAAGTMTINEARAYMGDNPMNDPAADKLYMQSGFAPLESLGEPPPTAEPATPAPAPASPAPEPSDTPADNEENMRVLFHDAAMRVCRKEEMATENARKKGAESFAQWMDKFAPEQRAYMVDAFTPAVKAMGRSGVAMQQAVDSYLGRWLAQGKGEGWMVLGNAVFIATREEKRK